MKAFPNSRYPESADNGMDLRDYFAAKAMSEMFSGGWIHSGEIEGVDLDHLAKWSYKMADAMMKARNK